MKNKKAIVLPETLKLIIAILCIVLLIYLAVSIYGLFNNKTALEQAKGSMAQMSLKLDKIEKYSENSTEFLLESPAKWYLISFPYKDGVETPSQCKRYCICICMEGDKENALNSCANGICKDVSRRIETFNDAPIYITGPMNLIIKNTGNKIIVNKAD